MKGRGRGGRQIRTLEASLKMVRESQHTRNPIQAVVYIADGKGTWTEKNMDFDTGAEISTMTESDRRLLCPQVKVKRRGCQ